jgi:hypothetical protein
LSWQIVVSGIRHSDKKSGRNEGEGRYRLHRVYMAGENCGRGLEVEERDALGSEGVRDSVLSGRSGENAVDVSSLLHADPQQYFELNEC